MNHKAHLNPNGTFDRYGRPARFDVILQYTHRIKTLYVARDLPKGVARRLRDFINQ